MIVTEECPGNCSCGIKQVRRTIHAISEHVAAQDALAGRRVCISIEESADFGVIITGLQVIQACLAYNAIAIRGDLDSVETVLTERTIPC